jgi:glutamine amidotransferase
VKTVAIINYGAGNLASLVNALNYLNHKVVILNKPTTHKKFSHIILPGVGSFGKLAKNLKLLGFDKYLKDNKEKGNFILGICVGMQLLFNNSDEGEKQNGLGLINGKFELFKFSKKKLPLPNIGFSKVDHKNSTIWKNIPNNSNFYFIHSYRITKLDKNVNFSTSIYGEKFISFVEKNNIFGSQFHPEKSHKVGLRFLDNFLNLK